MFLKNLLVMCFILSPIFILFGMIIFSGKPKDQLNPKEADPIKPESNDNR